MPERPELDYQVPLLRKRLVGRRVTTLQVFKPVVWRVALPQSPAELMIGRSFIEVQRRAHTLVFLMDGLILAIAPMLAGRWFDEGKKRADAVFVLGLDDDRQLAYADDVQMGRVFLLPEGAAVPGAEVVGIDVRSTEFSKTALTERLRARREQIKLVLMDKAAFDAFGNAYADEALWAAQINPKRPANKLNPDELDRLARAMRTVLDEAAAEVEARQPALHEKVRDFLKIRNRAGQPCPRCGTSIRALGVRGHDAFFCPSCQVDTSGRSIVDWRKLGGPPNPS